MSVGRKRVNNDGLPRRVYYKHGRYYYVNLDNKWIALGKTLQEAYRTLANMRAGGKRGTVAHLLGEYLVKITPTKSTKQQKDDHRYAANLNAVFGHMAMDALHPADIAHYLRSRSAPVAANRERALLSHAYSMGMEWRLVATNPCIGVKRNKERPRDRYVEDYELWAILRHTSPMLRRYLALYYYTAQRPGDVLRVTRQQLTRSDGILFLNRKTGKKVLVAWTPDLRAIVAYVLRGAGDMLVFHYRGRPYTYDGIKSAFQRAHAKATAAGDLAEPLQLRDIRPKAASDGGDAGLLAHASTDFTRRVYIRKPQAVKPVR